MAAKKRRTTKTGKAAVTAKLRAMVEDVERWPLSDRLLKAIEELEDTGGDVPGSQSDAPPVGKKPRKS
jgi:uncharacterized Ntn-hydrolase superfamily protein